MLPRLRRKRLIRRIGALHKQPFSSLAQVSQISVFAALRAAEMLVQETSQPAAWNNYRATADRSSACVSITSETTQHVALRRIRDWVESQTDRSLC